MVVGPIALAALLLVGIPMGAQAAVTVETTAFVTSPIAMNDFEQVIAPVFVNAPYSQGGITIRYVSSDPSDFGGTMASPGSFDLGGGSTGWYSIGYHGYTSITLSAGQIFNQIQFLAATGFDTSGLQYDLLVNGVSVGTGLAGSLTPFSNNPNAGQFYGFSGADFDEVRIKNTPLTDEFRPNAQDALNLDNISIGFAAVGAVPEPSTWALMLIGFGIVGTGIRRRARSARKALV